MVARVHIHSEDYDMKPAKSAIAVGLIGLALAATNAAGFTPLAASGKSHTLFLTERGLVTAVGSNASGQLGNGTTSPSAAGVQASGLTNVVSIAAGAAHSLALEGDGTVWAWGANDTGQLGVNDTNPRNVPTQVPGLPRIVAIAAGQKHSLALAADGTVYAWGLNSDLQSGGACGVPGTNALTPVKVTTSGAGSPCVPGAALTGVTQIAAGGAFNVALRSNGTVWTWGDNGFGELGNGGGADSAVPVQVPGLTGVTHVAAGDAHALALKIDTRAVAWGRNNFGQLGDNTTTDSSTPVDVSIPSALPPDAVPTKGVALIAAGREHSLLVYQTGQVATWGNNASGQLGTASYASIPVALEVGGYDDSAGVYAGPVADRSFVYVPGHSAFGTFQSFGANANGEIGTGSAGSDQTTPVNVTVVTAVGDKVGKRTNFRIDANRSDIVWRHASGQDVAWDYTTTSPVGFMAAGLPSVPANWQALGTADVNGDGRSDVLWLDTTTGLVTIWLMSGPGTIASITQPGSIGAPSSWQYRGAGDLDGDGHADLLWHNTSTSQVLVWYMNADGQVEQATPIGAVSAATWKVAGIADVNGDWIADIVWFRESDGQVAVWRMAPTGQFQGLFPAAVGPGSSWRIYRVGDFDGDGRDDIFWRNSADGTNAVWYMGGGNRVVYAQFFVGTPLAEWSLESTGDFDGDGRDDLMWIGSNSGSTVRWLMQGRASDPVYQGVLGVGTGWHAVQ